MVSCLEASKPIVGSPARSRETGYHYVLCTPFSFQRSFSSSKARWWLCVSDGRSAPQEGGKLTAQHTVLISAVIDRLIPRVAPGPRVDITGTFRVRFESKLESGLSPRRGGVWARIQHKSRFTGHVVVGVPLLYRIYNQEGVELTASDMIMCKDESGTICLMPDKVRAKDHRLGRLNQALRRWCSSTAPIAIVVFRVTVGAMSTVREPMVMPMTVVVTTMVAVAKKTMPVITEGTGCPPINEVV